MATISNTLSITTSEDSRNNLETDLNNNTEDEIQTDTSNWTLAKKKKLQHMIDFHTEYQQIFGEQASLCTIMKRRIFHMNPLFLNLFMKKKCKMPIWTLMKL